MKESHEGERQVRNEKQWQSLGKVIMPIVAAIENSKILTDVKVQELVRWERPFAEVVEIGGCRNSDDGRTAEDSFSK